MEHYEKHYIVVDDMGRILDGWSSGPRGGKATDGAILLSDRGGYQFRLSEDGEENPALTTPDGIPRYRWDRENVTARTAEEIEEERKPTAEELAAAARTKRDALLAKTDKYAVLDAPISAETRDALYDYRQDLRDVPEQAGFPADVIWPVMPTITKAAPDPVDRAFDVMTGGNTNA